MVCIGAAPDNDIVLDLPIVSWHHAVIRIVGDLITIEDLGSTNGTAVGSPENWIRHCAVVARQHDLFISAHSPYRLPNSSEGKSL